LEASGNGYFTMILPNGLLEIGGLQTILLTGARIQSTDLRWRRSLRASGGNDKASRDQVEPWTHWDIFGRLQRQYTETLRALLPYERPKLQVVKVKTDHDQAQIAPEEMAKSLAKALTPEELELLDKVALKLVSAPSIIEARTELEV
jgi:hypothetical protein